MGATCNEIIGIVMLVITNMASIVMFATPYWIEFSLLRGGLNKGLWAICDQTDCTWMFDNGYEMVDRHPAWFKATQGLMTVGLGLGLIALLIATMSLCCSCQGCNPHHPICGLLVVASVSMAVGIVIFGIKANQDWNIDLQWELMSEGRFGWSFWVADGAAAMALLTSVMYCCMGRKHH